MYGQPYPSSFPSTLSGLLSAGLHKGLATSGENQAGNKPVDGQALLKIKHNISLLAEMTLPRG